MTSKRRFWKGVGAFAYERLADLLSPHRCAACDVRVRVGVLFCAPCAARVERHAAGDDACDGLAPVRCEVLAPFSFGGSIAEAIHRLKYGGRPDLASPLARTAHGALPLPADVDALVPVPLARGRLVERGYNQSALIARALSSVSSVPTAPFLLERTRETGPQAKLARAERKANVDGAFAVTRNDRVRGRHIALVDDVCTTGATARACAVALLDAGAHAVTVWVIARA
jgi:ComF family protein